MTTFTNKHHSWLVVAAMAAALLALLAIGPAPRASAFSAASTGTPGSAEVNRTAGTNDQVMIQAFKSGSGVAFYTNGATVTRSKGSSNPQTIKAEYRLEYWAKELNTWVLLRNYDISLDVAGYTPGDPYISVTFPGSWFTEPELEGPDTAYRIIYTVAWMDKVTSTEIGHTEIDPTVDNNLCTSYAGPCKAYTEDIRLS